MQLRAQLTQVQKGENRSGGAAFHVAGAAPVDAAVDKFAAPRVVRPAAAITHREAVDMAIECEMTAGFSGLERRHDVRHDLVWRNHPAMCTVTGQELTDMSSRFSTRVGGRVCARTADDPAEKIKQELSVALAPLQQLRFAAIHIRFSARFGRAIYGPAAGPTSITRQFTGSPASQSLCRTRVI